MAFGEHGNGMGLAAADLFYFHLPQSDDQLWLGLVGTAVLIFGHAASVRVTKLSAATTTPREEATFVRQRDRVRITTCNLHYLDCLKKVNETRCRLVRIALDIRG